MYKKSLKEENQSNNLHSNYFWGHCKKVNFNR